MKLAGWGVVDMAANGTGPECAGNMHAIVVDGKLLTCACAS